MLLRRLTLLAVALSMVAGACGGSGSGGRVRVVAALYPLAWAAEQVGGDRVEVEDLTPPGTDAHDTTLTAAQRADIETADVVVFLGDIGFQPDIERAVADAQGRIVSVTAYLRIPVPSDTPFDPHVWLDPVNMEGVVRALARALSAADPAGRAGYEARAADTEGRLSALDASFRSRLRGCRFTTFVATHEAFGYLAREYGLHQVGIEGLTPESEPSAASIQAAAEAIRAGRAAPVIFYETTDEGRRIGESVAADIGVPALPLGTLESDPAPQGYLSVMRADLANLAKGLQCGT
jgi:zinc transport system substrate-binding protein